MTHQNTGISILPPHKPDVALTSLYRTVQQEGISYFHLMLQLIAQIAANLFAHKTRSILTAVGVIIGIGSVFTIYVLSDSGTAQTRALLTPYKDGTIIVRPASRHTTVGDNQSISITPFNPEYIPVDDYYYLKSTIDKNVITAVQAVRHGVEISCRGYRVSDCECFMATPELFSMSKLACAEGRFLTLSDTYAAMVAIDERGRFGDLPFSVLGEKLVINDCVYTVAGTIRTERELNSEPKVYIPFSFTTHQEIEKAFFYAPPANKSHLLERLRSALKLRSRGNIEVLFAEKEFMDVLDALSMISQLLSLIAAVSLVVGCIGVTNTLLASVKESTFEIGVRRTFGASARIIFLQVIVESLLLCCIAGIIGICCGWILGTVFCRLNSIPPVIRPLSIVASFIASIAVGLFGGCMPAIKASRLNIWQALRQG